MARIRTVKPEFWTDEKLTECSLAARLLFIGTWNFADDQGRAEYSPKRLKMQIFPADDVDVEVLADELAVHGLLRMYEADGHRYFYIPNFSKHQRVDHPSASKIPAPPDSECTRECSRGLREDSAKSREGARVLAPEGNGMEGKGSLSERERPKPEIRYEPDFDDGFDVLVSEIGHQHPANAHLKGKALPHDQEQAIAEAVQRDGKDAVLAGTRNLRDAVATWPKAERRFIPNPARFYRHSEYLKDPAVWAKTQPQNGNDAPGFQQAPHRAPDDLPLSEIVEAQRRGNAH